MSAIIDHAALDAATMLSAVSWSVHWFAGHSRQLAALADADRPTARAARPFQLPA
jgi:hypothetical protein